MDNNPAKHEASPLDATDRRLLDALQQEAPLDHRPYQALADRLNLAEQDILTRLQRIRSQGLISRISAIFDTRRLGYESVLVAAKYRSEDLDRAAAIINEHPGVSHNYLRTADYNLWYTLAVPPDSRLGLARTAATLSRLTGAIDHRLLPAEQVFKIGVKLPMSQDEPDPAASVPEGLSQKPSLSGTTGGLPAGATGGLLAGATGGLPAGATGGLPASAAGVPTGGSSMNATVIAPQIRPAVLALQEDLPIEPQPFDCLASRHNLAVEQLLATGRDLLATGIMRRFAAVLRHRQVGFAVNCMTVWRVPAVDVERVGQALASFAEVTHCYLRPAWSDWPYNLYGMIHCRSNEQCYDLIERMKTATGITDMLAAYSTKEFKKVRLQYFSPAFVEWESRHAE